MDQSRLPVRTAIEQLLGDKPRPLSWLYRAVARLRPETAPETVRARIYEGTAEGRFTRVAPGVYYARSGPAALVVIESDAWEALRALDDDSLDALVTDPPGKFGREWAGTGTTRPHSSMGGRTYAQPELDEEFMQQAFRVLKKAKPWNTLSKARRERGTYPTGGAACVIRVPLENRTTRPHVQRLIRIAEQAGFVLYGEVIIALDRIGMGYDAGRDFGAKWLVFHAGPRNGVLWDLGLPNIISARRRSNPAKANAQRHEAEKDAQEVLPILRAILRQGETVMDCFAGAGAWIRAALAEGYNVLAVEKQTSWAEALATGRTEL